ncbi:gamma-butyrobetaine dioxygenase [Aplysia californica]|uniref:Gamma-butyrobetaine dioxygenase n=1 Tax=Aplysia californica TaxID=6500 RepID=A0ABM1VQV7_APLCA|nr:gamma-butyrobetaine dioxygenase [Aplysia californica]
MARRQLISKCLAAACINRPLCVQVQTSSRNVTGKRGVAVKSPGFGHPPPLLLHIPPLVTRPQLQHFSTASHAIGDSSPMLDSTTLSHNGKTCLLRWQDGFQSEFHSVWLRHSCHCPLCRHDNGQRLLDPATIQASCTMERIQQTGSYLEILWRQNGEYHSGHVPIEFLRDHNYNEETMLATRKRVKCAKSVTEIPTVQYDEIRSSQKGLLKWLQQINEAGLSIVKGVPTEDSMVLEVAELIAPVSKGIYGYTFDVEAMPDAINVAYTNVHLDLHMDLVYFESPPGLQLLHCLKFDQQVEGGESVFLDVFSIVDEFRAEYPHLFDTLTKVPATFQKVHYDRDYPVHIVNQKPHIKLNHLGEVIAVYWAPPFEGPLAVAAEDVENYYRAYEMFAKALAESAHMLRYRLQPGDLVIFNNLRILHGRDHFTLNGGMRHLKGCYLNIDLFKSKTQVLSKLVGDGRPAKRVGNQCFF